MNSIPLIKGNTPQEINTSIIALKKALSELEAQDRLLQGTDKDVQDKIKQINELIEGINTHLGTVDTHLTIIDGQITALQPVDTVTWGNMHSVTSNGVAEALKSFMFSPRYHYTLFGFQAGVWSNVVTVDLINESGIYIFDFNVYDGVWWWYEHLTFVIFWFASPTNSDNSSHIYFNQAGHAPNTKLAQLRFQRTVGNNRQQSIQIYFDAINTSISSIEVTTYKIA